MPSPHATVAILSIGQMGLGIAQLLLAHNYRVVTNVSDRSTATQQRARSSSLTLVHSDEELIESADFLLSIVPPRDAVATAKRIELALSRTERSNDFYYLDLNAISPATAKSIQESFASHSPSVRFIDGGIIGGPPAPSSAEKTGWKRPGIPLSGLNLSSVSPNGDHLASVLNTRYLGPQVGSASGLKCCFAALSKGFTALAIQSYTTASALDILEPLQDYLDMYSPGVRAKAESGIVGCTSKAYRWVEEMNQIGETFAAEGGWKEQARVFRQIAEVYQELADVVEEKGTKEMSDVKGTVGILGQHLKAEVP
ncbi:hypothetical protein ACN47E_006343 [Coniothyrium glycines]